MNEEQFQTACAIADFAAWLDGEKNQLTPDVMLEAGQEAERLHDVVEMLAGERACEIYCMDDEGVTA